MIALCHLVRAANGIEPFDRFMRSYEMHDAGVEHELVIIFKGFGDKGDLGPFRERMAGHGSLREIVVGDEGFDMGAYLSAALALGHERLCFVNSFAEVLADRWLGILDEALTEPGTGIAGATGSWASHRSAAAYLIGLGGVYRQVLGPRRVGRPALASVAGDPEKVSKFPRLGAAAGLPEELLMFPGFPDPHLRTNAFLISRKLFLSLKTRPPTSKRGAYRFEAGYRGITRQVLNRGLEARLATRDGRSLPVADWPEAECYWQGTQRDLLVADNQTRLYEEAPLVTQQVLAAFAWGDRARGGDRA